MIREIFMKIDERLRRQDILILPTYIAWEKFTFKNLPF